MLLNLLGDLESFKKNPIVMKEGVEYKVKITFKVRGPGLCESQDSFLFVVPHCWRHGDVNAAVVNFVFVVGKRSAGYDACCLFLQVNREIVSGLKYIQQSFRKGVKGKIISL